MDACRADAKRLCYLSSPRALDRRHRLDNSIGGRKQMIRRTLLTKLFGIAAAAVPLPATVAVAASRRPVKTIAYIEQQRSVIVTRFKRYHDDLPGTLKTIADMYPDHAASDRGAVVARMRDSWEEAAQLCEVQIALFDDLLKELQA
jgi:hypothetical protein